MMNWRQLNLNMLTSDLTVKIIWTFVWGVMLSNNVVQLISFNNVSIPQVSQEFCCWLLIYRDKCMFTEGFTVLK